jgi:head-tail adaptor
MRAGQLDRRITIQRPVDVVDPVYGPQEGGWENLLPLRIPANKKDALPSKTESVTNGGLQMSNSPARIRIRYRKDITSDMRVIVHDEDDRIYQISSTPAEIGRREWIEFTVARYSS